MAIASKGTQLQIEVASVFTPIAEITDLSGPDAEARTFEALALDSGVGVPYLPTGHTDGGNVTWSMFWDPVGAVLHALTDLLTNPALNNFKLIWSDAAATEWDFNGILTTVNPSATPDDGLKADGGVKLNGIPVYPTTP